jgi:hypothetical protein
MSQLRKNEIQCPVVSDSAPIVAVRGVKGASSWKIVGRTRKTAPASTARNRFAQGEGALAAWSGGARRRPEAAADRNHFLTNFTDGPLIRCFENEPLQKRGESEETRVTLTLRDVFFARSLRAKHFIIKSSRALGLVLLSILVAVVPPSVLARAEK